MIRSLATSFLAGTIIAAGLVGAMIREADAGPSFPEGILTCAQAQYAAASARPDVPRRYLNRAVEGVCSGTLPIVVVTISGRLMDTISPGIRLAGLASPTDMGSVEQDTCVVFITDRADRWALLAHEAAHCPPDPYGWRH